MSKNINTCTSSSLSVSSEITIASTDESFGSIADVLGWDLSLVSLVLFVSLTDSLVPAVLNVSLALLRLKLLFWDGDNDKLLWTRAIPFMNLFDDLSFNSQACPFVVSLLVNAIAGLFVNSLCPFVSPLVDAIPGLFINSLWPIVGPLIVAIPDPLVIPLVDAILSPFVSPLVDAIPGLFVSPLVDAIASCLVDASDDSIFRFFGLEAVSSVINKLL